MESNTYQTMYVYILKVKGCRGGGEDLEKKHPPKNQAQNPLIMLNIQGGNR